MQFAASSFGMLTTTRASGEGGAGAEDASPGSGTLDIAGCQMGDQGGEHCISQNPGFLICDTGRW